MDCEARLFLMIANILWIVKFDYDDDDRKYLVDCEVRLFLMILNILWIIQPVHGDELVRLVEVKEEDVRTLNKITMIFFKI